MSTQTDTPKTDAAIFRREHRGLNNMWTTEEVPADFARTLERQNRELAEALNDAINALDTLAPFLRNTPVWTTCSIGETLTEARAALTKAAL